MFFYNDKINKYFLNPKYYGTLDKKSNLVITIEDGSKKLGKYIIFQIMLDDTRSYIKKAAYKAYACGATIASLEWLANKITDQKLEVLDSIIIDDIVTSLELPKNKLHCALTIEDIVLKIKTSINI